MLRLMPQRHPATTGSPGPTAVMADADRGPPPASAARPGRTGTAEADTRMLDADGTRYAYRMIGEPGRVPLVCLNRFRGTMDDWDPLFIDRIAAHRPVILFDYAGVARSGGAAALTMRGWAENAAAFIDGLGLEVVDLLGFSFGGLVAQDLTHLRPGLVRRLVIVGSGAGYVAEANVRPEAIEVATKPVNTDEDFLYLFFRDTPTSRAAGRAYLARLRQRADAHAALVSAKTWSAMLAAGATVGTPETSLLNRAPAITQPVLVANGVEDAMIPTFQSYALAQAIPNARLILYPDAGHAFMFQYPEAFGDEVVRFLGEGEAPR